ncbi:MAG TPA: regulatory protein RecX [Vicinamibacterales bacterium]|nr:regulatory protein RecX [Vicinamibacterales bacterium]
MDAYTTALTLLGRRELSARQLRDRLARRQFPPEDIETVIDRLIRDRTLDDRRVAVASARMAATIKGRGRRRVFQYVQSLGVSSEVASAAVAEVFDDVDEAVLLERALDKRLRGSALRSLDIKARARLIRQLIAQGFEPAAVFARLHRKGADADE